MNTIFPFGLPTSTAFYAMLYVATWVLHAVFMNYMLAGSLYVAWTGLMPGTDTVPRPKQPLAATLRDWMPFVLSATVTAGVAPLLFVQLLYPKHFYTSNLLLSWRWMVLIPVLIAAFYLLYLLKSKTISQWSAAARNAVGIGTAACIVFAAFCWTANHLLSADPDSWPDVFQSESIAHLLPSLIPRLLTTIAGSFSTMCVFAAWQLYGQQKQAGDSDPAVADLFAAEIRRMTYLTIGGLGIAIVMLIWHVLLLPEASTAVLFFGLAIPYLVLVVIGAALQGAGWYFQMKDGCFCAKRLLMITGGCVLTLLGVGVLREAIRFGRIDVTTLYARHEAAFEIGGFGLFLVIAVINIGLMIWCVQIIRSGLRQT